MVRTGHGLIERKYKGAMWNLEDKIASKGLNTNTDLI